MRARGLEPPRALAHRILNPARLPFRHARVQARLAVGDAAHAYAMADAGSVVLGYGLTPMRTETTLLEGDRAVLEVEVPAERVEHDLQHTLGHLAHSVRVPGFRKGRVPPAVVLQRLGREEVLDETLREHLDRWYADALNESRLKPIEQPDIDWKVLPDEGEPFRFTATMRLRPLGSAPSAVRVEHVERLRRLVQTEGGLVHAGAKAM